MQRRYGVSDNSAVSEMTIVDTFTKLIFGIEGDFTPIELQVIEAFRAVDANIYRDTPVEMGEYLRNLGVREMIHLVARVREHMQESFDLAATNAESSVGLTDRRTH